MTTEVLTFGTLEVSKGETDNPRDLNIKLIGFDFSDESSDPLDKLIAILDYIREQLN